jgi:hypothetical protein
MDGVNIRCSPIMTPKHQAVTSQVIGCEGIDGIKNAFPALGVLKGRNFQLAGSLQGTRSVPMMGASAAIDTAAS